jgi:ATP-binding cassette, subfamily F, member 3
MDEPTTHLDVGSIDALIGALRQYEGTLIFISHDVHFIRAIASSVLHINAGQLTPYAGDYQYYLDKSMAGSERAALTAGNDVTNLQPLAADRGEGGAVTARDYNNKPGLREQKQQKRAEAELRKTEAKARREREQRVHELEMHIATLEGQQKELAIELEDPVVYEAGGRAVAINRELSAVSDELARLTAEWEKATAGFVSA